jgi:predicted secreted protein
LVDIAPIIVAGMANHAIELPIADGPPTGYSWQLDLPAGVVRIDDAPAKQAEPENRLGASATGALRVIAPKGHYRITGRLVRPWEPNHPLKTMVMELVVE